MRAVLTALMALIVLVALIVSSRSELVRAVLTALIALIALVALIASSRSELVRAVLTALIALTAPSHGLRSPSLRSLAPLLLSLSLSLRLCPRAHICILPPSSFSCRWMDGWMD